MSHGDGHVVIVGGNHRLVAEQIGDGKIGCVATVAVRHHKLSGRRGQARRPQEIIDRNAAPSCVELRPLRDAVNISYALGLLERFELFPAPLCEQLRAPLEREGPILTLRALSRAGSEYGEILSNILARWYPIMRRVRVGPFALKPPCNRHRDLLRKSSPVVRCYGFNDG